MRKGRAGDGGRGFDESWRECEYHLSSSSLFEDSKLERCSSFLRGEGTPATFLSAAGRDGTRAEEGDEGEGPSPGVGNSLCTARFDKRASCNPGSSLPGGAWSSGPGMLAGNALHVWIRQIGTDIILSAGTRHGDDRRGCQQERRSVRGTSG
jgi:hypothetical protein